MKTSGSDFALKERETHLKTEIFCCGECGAEIGRLLYLDERVWLAVGNIQVKYLHGRCGGCYKIIHFDARNYQLEKLILRVKRAKIILVE